MVRYSGAHWDPLGPQTERRMRSHDIACLHTMVGSLAGTSSMFHQDGYGGTESHFGLGAKGEMLQWQDIAFEADANLDGNDRVISLETADRGVGFPAWSDSDVPAWTAAQVDAIVAWLLWVTSKEAHADCPSSWLCHQHGIPRVLIPDTGLTRRGIAFHRQGVESYPTPYQPGWLQPGCEKWSASRGKVCPGDRRIRQLTTEIIPRLHAQPPEDDMTPDQANKLEEIHTAVFGGKPNEIARQVWALRVDNFPTASGSAADYLRRLVRAAGDDVDEAEVAALVLAGLDPAAIAAAIPDTLAQDVAEELASRLAD